MAASRTAAAICGRVAFSTPREPHANWSMSSTSTANGLPQQSGWAPRAILMASSRDPGPTPGARPAEQGEDFAIPITTARLLFALATFGVGSCAARRRALALLSRRQRTARTNLV